MCDLSGKLHLLAALQMSSLEGSREVAKPSRLDEAIVIGIEWRVCRKVRAYSERLSCCQLLL